VQNLVHAKAVGKKHAPRSGFGTVGFHRPHQISAQKPSGIASTVQTNTAVRGPAHPFFARDKRHGRTAP